MRDSSFYQAQDGFIYLDLSTRTYGCIIQMTWKQILGVLVDLGGLGLDSEVNERTLQKAYGITLQNIKIEDGTLEKRHGISISAADAGVDWNYGGTAFHVVES